MFFFNVYYISSIIIIIDQVSSQCNSHNETTLSCQFSDLNEINNAGRQYQTTIKEIEVNQINSAVFPDYALQFPNLEKLTLSGNLRKLHSKSLHNLNKLQQLNLANNAIMKIPNNFFEFSPNLTIFNISHNDVPDPNWDTFWKLNRIEIMDVSYNKIVDIPVGTLTEIRNVRELIMNNNDILFLELGVIDELRNMLILDVSHNNISSIPLGIFDKPNKVTDFDISYNQLRGIRHGTFAALRDLKQLNLSHNKINEFLLGILDGPTNLITLHLSHNRLKPINSNIFQHSTSLQYLHMSNCNLDEIPNGLFDQTPQLKYLDLSNNKLTKIPTFNTNLELTELYLAHNFIANLQISQQLPLDLIDLSYNKIATIPANTLNMPSLRTIKIRNNRISYLDPETLGKKLQNIDFRQNRLVFIEDQLFDEPSDFRQFLIADNPWDCKCLDDLMLLLSTKFIIYDTGDDFDGSKPICVVGNLHQCARERGNLTIYYEKLKGQ